MPRSSFTGSRGRFFTGSDPWHSVRHRLVKKDPGAARSEPVEPIIYYLDRAVPEPYRSAFKEGAGWWNEMFEEAGFVNAFRVEDMPKWMDPLDARYHVIQWMHRSESGSSVGPSFVDPRTGEIIKAVVRMDSHRSLANHDLYAAMLPALLANGGERPEGEAEAYVMSRRKQHAAQKVGHTLGLAHNFIAAFDGRASVMAYPAPLVRLTDGRLDVSDAYAPGPGAYTPRRYAGAIARSRRTPSSSRSWTKCRRRDFGSSPIRTSAALAPSPKAPPGSTARMPSRSWPG